MLQSFPGIGIAGGEGPSAGGGAEGGNTASGGGEEPVAEAAAAGVVLEPADGAADGAEDVLGEVGGVGVLESVSAGESVDEGGVEFDELPPGVAVVRVAESVQEGRPGRRHVGHAALDGSGTAAGAGLLEIMAIPPAPTPEGGYEK